MTEISFEEFSEEGNSMVGAASEKREFYRGDEELGVVRITEDGRKVASILRDSRYFDHKRSDETKFFNSRKDVSDVREWLEENIG
jgi:hypothetical protein